MRRPVVYAGVAFVAAGLSFATAVARPDPNGPPPLDGAELFHVKGCATCHEGPGVDTMMGVGPSLAHAPNWASTRVEGMTAEEYLAQSIAQPSAFISPAYTGGSGPSVGMPLLQMSSEEIDALVSFLLEPPDDATPSVATATVLDTGTRNE